MSQGDPRWFRDAIIYELHVRAFHDSDADGIGDFRGLAERLDYLADLGVTALWLLPFYPSPLRDDGYDIADYTSVHPSYGTLKDFREFLDAAHERGLRVITELVINHTSDEHPWFQRARQAPKGSPEREFYVWSDTPERYQDARIIFKDFEHSNWSWDREAGQYYWHRFYSHQPDLNYENPAVLEAVLEVLDFWMDMGVDGMRLDAVPYLIEEEGTNCENLEETHEILKRIRAHVDERYEARMLLAEANQWPEDAAAYFGDGDECHMNFHFPLMPRLFMAVQQEDRFPILDILEQTPEIPDGCQWAIFLRNHDELTLEMVTDEERDYMYRAYASDPRARINLGIRRRLAPLLANNRRKIELMNGLLFSLPGTPVLYYGDEIGMGDNFYLGDRNGVRTPMQWSGDRNAGFSRANPQRLYLPVIIDPEYHYEALNVEAQQANPSSLLWWMKRMIGLRARFQSFGRGELRFLYPDNRKVLAFVREHQDERILVVANLSRFTQAVEIDLSEFAGDVPVELIGRVPFPEIGDRPYFFTLGPHTFHWFALEGAPAESSQRGGSRVPRREALATLSKAGEDWTRLFEGRARRRVEELLPGWLGIQRWYRSKARSVRSVELDDAGRVDVDGAETVLLRLVTVEFADGDRDVYFLPIAHAAGEEAGRLLDDRGEAVLARVEGDGSSGILYDALVDPRFGRLLLATIARDQTIDTPAGELEGRKLSAFDLVLERKREEEPLERDPEADVGPRWSRLRVVPGRAEQSNTSVAFGESLILKVFRKLEEGVNQDVELGTFLSERNFEHAPRIAGTLTLRRGRREPVTVGLLQEYVDNEGDAWSYTLDALEDYFGRMLAERPEVEIGPPTARRLVELAGRRRDAIGDEDGDGDDTGESVARERIGGYLDEAERIGRRTARMHDALASEDGDQAYAPETFSTLYQRSLYQSMRNLTGNVMDAAARASETVPELAEVVGKRSEILRRFRRLIGGKLDARRTRVHGDYHLGQLLFTGRDWVITDFEGEPARPVSERRLKRSPLRDVASMLRSFHYAAHSAARRQVEHGLATEAQASRLATYWYEHVAAAFLQGYFDELETPDLVPARPEERTTLLEAYLLEKAIYEIGYELNNRPDWVALPLRGLLELLRDEERERV